MKPCLEFRDWLRGYRDDFLIGPVAQRHPHDGEGARLRTKHRPLIAADIEPDAAKKFPHTAAEIDIGPLRPHDLGADMVHHETRLCAVGQRGLIPSAVGARKAAGFKQHRCRARPPLESPRLLTTARHADLTQHGVLKFGLIALNLAKASPPAQPAVRRLIGSVRLKGRDSSAICEIIRQSH